MNDGYESREPGAKGPKTVARAKVCADTTDVAGADTTSHSQAKADDLKGLANGAPSNG